jgi:hypothetical protein
VLYAAELEARMQTHFGLQKVADGSTGERFIILLEGYGKDADCSKPLSASDARTALHKLGNSDAVIESMFDRARNVSSEETSKLTGSLPIRGVGQSE